VAAVTHREGAFTGRTALITGAASGIGAATARLLHHRGARLILCDIDVDAGAAVAEELGERAVFRRLDVTDEHGWATLCAELEMHELNVLVHSAGAATRALLAETALVDFRRMLDLHLVGTFLALRSGIRLMSNGGSIVTLSSVRGVVATAGLGSYGAAKFGVRALTRVAALELADRRIRVNSVCPGSIATPIRNAPGFEMDDFAAYVNTIPLRRQGRAEEVARAIAFLAGDDASYVTGTDFVVDGGIAAGHTTPRRPSNGATAMATTTTTTNRTSGPRT
jgi:NAD(P)-dependent dehydrogenase (short-subunit alcohol dehydrogenase family)